MKKPWWAAGDGNYLICSHGAKWALVKYGVERARKVLANRPELIQYARTHVKRPTVLFVMTAQGRVDYTLRLGKLR